MQNTVVIQCFFKQTWETAGIIAKARKKHQKKSKYLDICESDLYHGPIMDKK